MKWERVPIAPRLICLIFGLCGVFMVYEIVTAWDDNWARVPVLHYIAGAFGVLTFLFVGVVGLFPDFVSLARVEKDKKE